VVIVVVRQESVSMLSCDACPFVSLFEKEKKKWGHLDFTSTLPFILEKLSPIPVLSHCSYELKYRRRLVATLWRNSPPCSSRHPPTVPSTETSSTQVSRCRRCDTMPCASIVPATCHQVTLTRPCSISKSVQSLRMSLHAASSRW
jgi:hypothetical protein